MDGFLNLGGSRFRALLRAAALLAFASAAFPAHAEGNGRISVVVADARAGEGTEPQSEDLAVPDTELGPVFMLSVGGKLYDDLWNVLGQSVPSGRNSAFPAGVQINPRETWRCVTCHGWDYRGGEGEQARRLPGARFPSLRDLDGADPVVAGDRIRAAHGAFLTGSVPELAIDILGAFLATGQTDEADFFDARGRSLGNPESGRDIFEGACINCHQIDGRRFLHGEEGDRSSLGWVVRNRPEQALHKIMNGVPATEMLALRFMEYWQIADLLAYLQALDPDER
ncbi:c-type cytochrome [Faunimonas sp. B44]|uniref:c-type cytochrome n=1 Tax=Faunimonas sp. B44 TaxID=3461493 RepID=UPI004043D867